MCVCVCVCVCVYVCMCVFVCVEGAGWILSLFFYNMFRTPLRLPILKLILHSHVTFF